MPFEYLGQDEIHALYTAALELELHEPETLKALCADIHIGFRATLPAAGAPNVRLLQTLHRLNGTRKLVGGQVPFVSWLNTAVLLTGAQPKAVVFRRALDKIASTSQGEPPVPGTDNLPELGKTVLQRVVHHNDMVPFGFLRRGHTAGLAVGRVEVPRYDDGGAATLGGGEPDLYMGTGWLIAPDLVVTNQHVVKARPDKEQPSPGDLKLQVEATVVRFDYEREAQEGTPVKVAALEQADVGRDYAVLRLVAPPAGKGRQPLAVTREPLVLAADSGKRIPVNVIQHPMGDPKRLACRNNQVSMGNETTLRYFTDTRRGSSGSPVCNDDWEVVALHRASTDVTGVSFQGMPVPWVNVGVQISAVLAHIEAEKPQLLAEIAEAQKQIGAPAWLTF